MQLDRRLAVGSTAAAWECSLGIEITPADCCCDYRGTSSVILDRSWDTL